MRISNEQKEDNRRRLLESGAEEFARYGLERANINNISVKAGFGKGTVYNYFSSKEVLFLEIVKEACNLAVQQSEIIADSASTRERLRTMVALDMEWVNKHEAFARVLLRELTSADMRFYPQLIESFLPYLSKIMQILDDGVKRGDIRNDVPTFNLALLFSGMSEMMLIQYWGSGKLWPTLDEIPDICVEQFIEGAKAKKIIDRRGLSQKSNIHQKTTIKPNIFVGANRDSPSFGTTPKREE